MPSLPWRAPRPLASEANTPRLPFSVSSRRAKARSPRLPELSPLSYGQYGAANRCIAKTWQFQIFCTAPVTQQQPSHTRSACLFTGCYTYRQRFGTGCRRRRIMALRWHRRRNRNRLSSGGYHKRLVLEVFSVFWNTTSPHFTINFVRLHLHDVWRGQRTVGLFSLCSRSARSDMPVSTACVNVKHPLLSAATLKRLHFTFIYSSVSFHRKSCRDSAQVLSAGLNTEPHVLSSPLLSSRFVACWNGQQR